MSLPFIGILVCHTQTDTVILNLNEMCFIPPLVFLASIGIIFLDDGSNLLDLDFSNYDDFSTDLPEYGIVQTGPFHPPFIADCTVSIRRTEQHFKISFRTRSAGD
jgi:hypothetical protein